MIIPMRDRLGFIAGSAVILSGGALLGAYEVQGKKMPGLIFGIIAVFGTVVLLSAVAVWTWAHVLAPLREWWGAHHWRTPFVRKDAPDPNQWLLDISKHQAENPEIGLVVTRQVLNNWDVDKGTLRPWIEVSITFRNASVHSVLIGPCKGHGRYQGQELPDPIENEDRTRVPPGSSYVLQLKQVVPREMVGAIYQERIDHKRITLGVGEVAVTIYAECPQGRERKWLLQVPDGFFRAED